MTAVLIVESNPADYPQAAHLFQSALAGIDAALTTRVVTPYETAMTEGDLEGVTGVIFTGSAVEWGVDAPQAAPLWRAMEQVFAAGLPAYGSCNGMQLAACVLGGACKPSPNGHENGLARAVQLTEAGLAHPFLRGRRQGFAVPCIHRDEVTTLPEGAVGLAGNAHSPVQAMAYETAGVHFWGVQYHPEISPAYMAGILDRNGLSDAAGVADLRAAETDEDAATRLGAAPEDLRPATRTVELRNWVDHITA